MVKDIVFASANAHKTHEIKKLLDGQYRVLNLHDIGCTTDIPETGDTFQENAFLKSSYVVQNYGLDCFADDSGLEISALNNEPGVYSARYSGQRDDRLNLELALKNLEGKADRSARFKTVISLIINNQNYFFEGTVEGNITLQPSGLQGFGYDPIFVPEGFDHTFAEMTGEKKNTISHRAIAVGKMVDFLKKR